MFLLKNAMVYLALVGCITDVHVYKHHVFVSNNRVQFLDKKAFRNRHSVGPH